MSISDELVMLNKLVDNGNEEDILDHIRTNNITPELAVDLSSVMATISWAAVLGRVNILNTLLSLGFTPHPDRHPIHYGSEQGQLAVVTSLVEDHNTDVMCVDKVNDSPMFLASRKGQLEIVKYLVERGADVNFGGRIPPLVIAVVRHQLHICDYLIKHGADVNIEDRYGRSPLRAAARKGYVDIAHTLVEAGASINVKCTDQQSPFMAGSQFGHLSVMKFLESHGANVNAIDKKRDTALHLAVREGHYEIVRYLLVDLCVVCTINSDCESPFSIALDNTDYDILLLFHKAGRWPSNMLCDFPPDTTEMLMPIIDAVTKPYLLQELACFRLRSMLGPKLTSTVNHLPVPGAIKNFIRLSHIPSCRP
ncbi:ankyrin repeat and KH domain-containing protein 1-like [Haliotis rubra]|uniref:ankyrin repeat and KH domain-containing protein 1-like n=1 Tax=Haliotis rubra TaxID=36100 RepID=UPI001EE5225B|nr:ankyrin repeat and KH domain-containing protein 1-like [Haliotis rubra]